MIDIRVIVAGGRDFTDQARMYEVLNEYSTAVFGSDYALSIVSGGARGADRMAEAWATAAGVPCIVMPANWKAHGKGAGHKRNREMAEVGDHLIAFWDGKSAGTRNMIDTARALGLTVQIVEYEV